MIVNRYKGARALVMRGTLLRKIIYCCMYPIVRGRVIRAGKEEPLFTQVEIETINRCNGVCPFCPINHHDDTREFAQMKEELFEEIIRQLADLNYKGNLGLFSNNEPFLDKRLVSFAKLAREKLPEAFIHIYTNGTILTKEKVLEIMPYLDRMVIDNYNDELELNPTSLEVLELCREYPELDKKIEIHLRKIHEVLYTRGGQAPNNQKKKTFHMPCLLPYEQLIIRPDGKVSLCCNDALGKFTMGDITKTKIIDIWHSGIYKKVRSKLTKNRSGLELCQYCDTVSL